MEGSSSPTSGMVSNLFKLGRSASSKVSSFDTGIRLELPARWDFFLEADFLDVGSLITFDSLLYYSPNVGV